jgi:hypothetical protein
MLVTAGRMDIPGLRAAGLSAQDVARHSVSGDPYNLLHALIFRETSSHGRQIMGFSLSGMTREA